MDGTERMARRTKVIDGRLQYRMIAIALMIIVAGVLLFAVVTLLYFLLARAGRGLTPDLLLVILPPLLLNDLAIMVVAIVAGLFLTNRIAGPVYRIERDVARALSGEKGVRVRLRRHDAFYELAEKVNAALERMDNAPEG
jgi:methyl-accepting chemotaxis protein